MAVFLQIHIYSCRGWSQVHGTFCLPALVILHLQKEPPSITQHPLSIGKAQVLFPSTSLPLTPTIPSFFSIYHSSRLIDPFQLPLHALAPIITLISSSRFSLLFLLPLCPISSFVLHDLFPLFSPYCFYSIYCRPALDCWLIPDENETTILCNDVCSYMFVYIVLGVSPCFPNLNYGLK